MLVIAVKNHEQTIISAIKPTFDHTEKILVLNTKLRGRWLRRKSISLKM